MQVSSFVLFGIIESYVVLIAACIFLLLHTRGLKALIKKLQQKLEDLVTDLRNTKASYQEAQQAAIAASSYKKQINDQLLLTRVYHETLDANQDIALDLSPDAPIERQVAAFRHALLIAEKEALHASEDDSPNWDVLQQRMNQLMQFYQGVTPNSRGDNAAAVAQLDAMHAEMDALQEALANSDKRVANLEKFKKLFFEMEDQWRDAKAQANAYYEQLSAMAGSVEDQESYEDILQRYNAVYDHVGDLIASGGAIDNLGGDTLVVEKAGKTKVSTIEVVKTDNKAAKELRELRSVAAEQHRVIHELQRKLSKATSAEEKDNLIADLNQELVRQSRFLQESEACMQLLETELSSSMQRVAELESQLETAGNDLQHIPKMKSVIEKFTTDSKKMLQGLSQLEQENQQLVAQLQLTSDSHGDSAKLEATQQELQTLRTQYADLEERYLELRMQA